MSSSVIMARTRICRTAVAIMRGENLCGAMWQRPQLVLKRFSPSMRMARSSAMAGEGATDGDFVSAETETGFPEVDVLIPVTGGAVSEELACCCAQERGLEPANPRRIVAATLRLRSGFITRLLRGPGAR